MRRSLFFCIAGCFVLATSPQKAVCGDCEEALTGLLAPAGAPLSKAQKEQIARQRVCLKGYPWFGFDKEATFRKTEEELLAAMAGKLGISKEEVQSEVLARPQTRDAFFQKVGDAYDKKFHAFLDGLDEQAIVHNRERVAALLAYVRGDETVYLSPEEAKYAREFLKEGKDFKQVQLWGDYYYAHWLSKNRKYEKLLALTQTIKQREGGEYHFVHSPLNEVEANTYYSPQQLINLLGAAEFTARRHLAEPGSPKYFEILAEFLDQSEKLNASVPKEVFDDMLPQEADVFAMNLDTPHWQQMQELGRWKNLKGVAVSNDPINDGVRFYVEGKGSYAIRIEDDKVDVIYDRAAIEADYRLFCAHDIESVPQARDHLIRLDHFADGYEVFLPPAGPTCKLSLDQFTKFLRRELPADDQLVAALSARKDASLTVYSNPYMKKPGQALDEQRGFAFAAQHYAPKVAIYRDPLNEETPGRIQLLDKQKFTAPGQMCVVVAKDSYDRTQRPEDWKAMQHIVPELKEHGAQVIEVGPDVPAWTAGEGKQVFVITGHADERLAAFVRQLGDAGYFRNNFIVLNSCETPVSEQLVAEITSRYGATAAFQHEGQIKAAKVEDALVKLCHDLKEGKLEHLREAVIQVFQECHLNGAWQISSRGKPAARPFDIPHLGLALR